MIPKRKYLKPVLDWRKQAKTCRYRSTGKSLKNPWCLFGQGPCRCTYERCQDLIQAGLLLAESLKRQLDEEDELDRS